MADSRFHQVAGAKRPFGNIRHGLILPEPRLGPPRPPRRVLADRWRDPCPAVGRTGPGRRSVTVASTPDPGSRTIQRIPGPWRGKEEEPSVNQVADLLPSRAGPVMTGSESKWVSAAWMGGRQRGEDCRESERWKGNATAGSPRHSASRPGLLPQRSFEMPGGVAGRFRAPTGWVQALLK
jgi:hypothetical protein